MADIEGTQSCRICARFHHIRKHLPDGSEEACRIHRIFQEHKDCVRRDFLADARAWHHAEEQLQWDSDGPDSILECTIDGMDQAKFRLPQMKNWDKMVEFEGMWRPCLHCTGTLTAGLEEMYLLTHTTQPKDSNAQCTAISVVIERSARKLQGRLPLALRVHQDNTCREGKNITFFTFMAWLSGTKRFVKGTEVTSAQVGHTKNKQDQRFAEVATAIKAEMEPLQDIAAIAALIRKRVFPRAGRTQHVMVMEGSWAWQRYFQPLCMSMTGHGASYKKNQQNIVPPHVFRFIRRCQLPDHVLQPAGEAVTVPEAAHPDDVFLLVKQYMSDVELCQAPVLFLPAERLRRLSPPEDILNMLVRRNTLSDRQIKELKKTALQLESWPWRMTDAPAYLRQVIDGAGQCPAPTEMPDISWLLAGKRPVIDLEPPPGPPSLLVEPEAESWTRQPSVSKIIVAKPSGKPRAKSNLRRPAAAASSSLATCGPEKMQSWRSQQLLKNQAGLDSQLHLHRIASWNARLMAWIRQNSACRR